MSGNDCHNSITHTLWDTEPLEATKNLVSLKGVLEGNIVSSFY